MMCHAKKGDQIRRVAMIFAGGPAPGANAVISAAATSFLGDDREVIAFLHGYSDLQEYHPVSHRLMPGKHYRVFEPADLSGIRNSRGIIIGTARANPAKDVHCRADLKDPEKAKRLHSVYAALVDLEIDALISIGGDDTLKSANFLVEYQEGLPADAPRVRVVHVPKTIDNDYRGIDFTFGFFTAVDVMAKELQNLREDAKSMRSYFIIESMGRKAGWLSYGVAIAGEANLVVAREDVDESLTLEEEILDPSTGEPIMERALDINKLADQIIDLIISREEKYNEYFGTVVLAEGLAEMLPHSFIDALARDEHGHIGLGRIDLGKLMAEVVSKRFTARFGRDKKVVGLQLGYESRCAPPHAFDVMLGSQLGIGAYRALVEEGLDAHMVSTQGQLELRYVPFSELINPETMKTEIRYIESGSDFHRLARFLESRTGHPQQWVGAEQSA